MAAAAVVIDRTELNQQAMIATDDFPRIYWGKSRSHRVVGVPEPALLTTNDGTKQLGERFRPQRQSAVQGLWMSRLKCMKPWILAVKNKVSGESPAETGKKT